MRKAGPPVLGILFIVAGALHFINPKMYEAIVPPYLPAHRELVLVSGFFEMLGGVGVLPAKTRTAAGFGLIALLIAVFPANLYMATAAGRFAGVGPPWVFYARLPLQAALIAWVYAVCLKRAE